MYVLGINSYSHDAGACLIKDDGSKVEVVAIVESRLNRVKRSLSFPLHSINYCLSYFGLDSLDQIDLICGVKHKTGYSSDDEMLQKVWLDRALKGDKRKDADFKSIYVLNNSFYRAHNNVHWCHHMNAHAASAYYVSGFDHSATLCIDAGGVAIYKGSGDTLSVIDRAGYSDSTIENGEMTNRSISQSYLGTLFMNATQSLGFSTEGTTMALACFAKEGAPFQRKGLSKSLLHNLIGKGELSFSKPKIIADFVTSYESQINEIHRYAKRHEKELKEFHATRYNYYQEKNYGALRPAIDIAYKTQTVLESEMVKLARLAKEKTGAKNLCIAGGVGLSCVTNRIIYDLKLFDDIFIQPAASDEGLAFGAAFIGYHEVMKGSRRYKMENAYFGKSYDIAEIVDSANKVGLEPAVSVEEKDVANLISQGAIIGRFFGRSEYGPRALGNRSILADPRKASVSKKINEIIKQREWFRPFAPACTLETCNLYFDMPMPGPYMIVAAPLRPEFYEQLAAVRHIDNSSRPQTVAYDQNPKYYNLIKAFGELTGYSVLLNTSFNSKKEPVVETPLEALMTAVEIGLDYVYIEDLLYKVNPSLRAGVERLREEHEVGMGCIYGELQEKLTSKSIYNEYSGYFI